MIHSPDAALLGLTAGLLSVIDPLPYIRDTLRGSTRPHRGTWGIWTVLGITAFAAAASEGVHWSLLMLGIQAFTISAVFALSFSRGTGGLSAPEVSMLALAAAGLVGWAVSSEPMVATVCVIVADVAGVLLMVPKTWRDPHSETAFSYCLASVAGVLATLAVGTSAVGAIAYPAYFAVANGFLGGFILLRRRSMSSPNPTHIVTLVTDRPAMGDDRVPGQRVVPKTTKS